MKSHYIPLKFYLQKTFLSSPLYSSVLDNIFRVKLTLFLVKLSLVKLNLVEKKEALNFRFSHKPAREVSQRSQEQIISSTIR